MNKPRIESLAPLRKLLIAAGAALLLAIGCVPKITPPVASMMADTIPRPLGLPNVINLHSVPVTPERLLYIARTQCINFFVDHPAEVELRQGGVRNEIIEGLKGFCVDLRTNLEERSVRLALEERVGTREAAERYFFAATAYMRAQRFGAAEGEIREAIRLAPRNSDYYSLLGESFFYQRRCDIAAAAFETVTQLDQSKGYFAFAKTGECFQLTSEWDKARDAYMRALDYEAPPSGRGWLFVRIAELPTRAQSP